MLHGSNRHFLLVDDTTEMSVSSETAWGHDGDPVCEITRDEKTVRLVETQPVSNATLIP
jgi:hypothetical protein